MTFFPNLSNVSRTLTLTAPIVAFAAGIFVVQLASSGVTSFDTQANERVGNPRRGARTEVARDATMGQPEPGSRTDRRGARIALAYAENAVTDFARDQTERRRVTTRH